MENTNDDESYVNQNKSTDLVSLNQDSKKEDRLIKTSFFFMNAFFAILIFSLYMYYSKGIVEAYESSPELTFVTIMILIRIIVMFFFSAYMFKKWFSQEKRYLKNIPFLVGLFFYFGAVGKCLDILLYIYYNSPYLVEEELLFLTKIRYFLIIITFIPLLFLGLRPVIYNFGFNREWNDDKVLRIRKEIIVLYAIVFGILIFIASNLFYIWIVLAAMSTFTYISIWYVFRFAHKNKTFPTIRADIVSLGFLIYLIFSPTRLVLSTFFSDILTTAQSILVGEILDFIINSIIFLGFVLKPK